MLQTEFDTFIDVSYETDEVLKTPEIIEREIGSLEILSPVRLPLPHEIAQGARRLLPHELLGLHVLVEHGAYRRVREYYEGWHPEEGLLTIGLQGEETVVERNSVTPIGTFEVVTSLEIPTPSGEKIDVAFLKGKGKAQRRKEKPKMNRIGRKK